jgi:23S rRNA-/tRNA-specific pseudouridylate synthase
LRLHKVIVGCPIGGDIPYQHPSNPENVFRRMCLHAYKLSFVLIGGEREIVAPDPFLESSHNEDTETKSCRVKIPGN